MSIRKLVSSFLQKIQGLPESRRKIILWTAVVIIGIGLAVFYIKDVQKIIKSFRVEKIKGELQLPKIEMPKIEIPKVNKEELKKLEEMMKATATENW